MSKLVLTGLSALLVFASTGRHASAEVLEVRWRPPTDTRVVGFNVYVSRYKLGALVSEAINVGRPARDASGISKAQLQSVDRTMPVGIEMTSYDSLGRESVRSNRILVDSRVAEKLGSELWADDFESTPIGETPEGFVDPSGTFRNAFLIGGNHALVARSSTNLVAAYLDDEDSLDWGNYEVSGQLMMYQSTAVAGIGVRADTDLDSYFGFGGDGSGRIALSQVGKAPLRCSPAASGGASFVDSSWFRFRLRVTDPSGRTRLRAKIWPSGTSEPAFWQSDCWTEVAVPLVWGELAFYRKGSGNAYWDNLLIRPVSGVPDPVSFP